MCSSIPPALARLGRSGRADEWSWMTHAWALLWMKGFGTVDLADWSRVQGEESEAEFQ